MPFAINEATRFISPTKTPEYLAGGCPVVSTPITDVIRHYGDMEAVRIADTADAFIAACDEALKMAGSGTAWLKEADMALNQMSWDKTFQAMSRLITPGSAPPRNRRSMCHLLRSGEIGRAHV